MEKRIRLDKRKLNDQKRRENEDSTARQARQSANKASLAKARAGENEEATKARQAADKASHAKARAGENEEVTMARQAANKASHARARAGGTERPTRSNWSCRGHATPPQRPTSVPTGQRTWKRSGFTVSVPRQAPLQMLSPR